MRELIDATQRLCSALDEAGVSYQIDGDAAIYLHMMKMQRFPRIARHASVLVNRTHDAELLSAVSGSGFEMSGREIRIGSERSFDGGIIGVVSCSDEEIARAPAIVEGLKITPIEQLVQSKLERFRLEDKLHVQEMDQARMITPEVEASLSDPLRARLAEVRATE